MLRTIRPEPGYCLYFPNRAEGERLIIDRSTWVWYWEEWRYVELGLFQVEFPERNDPGLFETEDKFECAVKANFEIMVGYTGRGESLEFQLQKATISMAPTRDITKRATLAFFHAWARNYCQHSIRKNIIKHKYEKLITEKKYQDKTINLIKNDLDESLKLIGLKLITATLAIESFESQIATHIEKSRMFTPSASQNSELNSESPPQSHIAESSRTLHVFLCHSSDDKPTVRELHKRLQVRNLEPWLDEVKLLPGQDWNMEIKEAVNKSDVVIVCLSPGSLTKRGYIHKEIKYALDIADEQPERTIFIIPLRLEPCVVPQQLSRWQWVDWYEKNGFELLMRALQQRADELGIAMILS